MAPEQFKVLRRGPQVQRSTETKPPESLLDEVPDGTIVSGPDGVQWISMPAIPRRWERAKRTIKPKVAPAAETAPAVPAAPAAQTTGRSK